VSEKDVCHLYFFNNFVKQRPILIILVGDVMKKLDVNDYVFAYFVLILLLHSSSSSTTVGSMPVGV